MKFSHSQTFTILFWILVTSVTIVHGDAIGEISNANKYQSRAVVVPREEMVFSNRTQAGKRYVGYNLYMNFMDFIEHCHKNGQQPAEVVSSEENAVLTSYLDGNFPPPKYFWLGGMDIGREGRYYWIASLSEFRYDSWYPGYPNGGTDENCATVYGGDGSWYDQYCTNDGVQPLCQESTLWENK